MAALQTPVCDFGKPAIDFNLPGVDGRHWSLAQCKGDNGLLIMFICNHCPYVKAVLERIVRDTVELEPLGIKSVAIMSNDSIEYPEDCFENMTRVAERYRFNFPYLLDESQEIAKAYGAVCTPDFFGYNAELGLQYRGRIDSSNKQTATEDAERELFNAMQRIAKTGTGPEQQIAGIGCSIKWKPN
ncbi:MAG: thioredoxin family protein [Methylobacter sp.]|nr:MAG: thioredoxin family protein [Methylobacter sp.]PPD24167.1 MAG: thioredoxin family protein [Methylobacter sp.]